MLNIVKITLLIGLFGSSIIFPSPSQAHNKPFECPYPGENLVYKPSKTISICRKFSTDEITLENSKEIESLIFYRWDNNQNLLNTIRLVIYEHKNKRVSLVSVGEYTKDCQPCEKARTTQFFLNGRSFQNWSNVTNPDAKLVNKYQKDITLLLNIHEQQTPGLPVQNF